MAHSSVSTGSNERKSFSFLLQTTGGRGNQSRAPEKDKEKMYHGYMRMYNTIEYKKVRTDWFGGIKEEQTESGVR